MLFTFLTWIAASFALVAFPVDAAPPSGCLENSKGQRWCDSFAKRFNPAVVRDRLEPVPWVHPATVKAAPKLYESPGQQVAALPVDEFLPGYRKPNYDASMPWVGVLPAGTQTPLSEKKK